MSAKFTEYVWTNKAFKGSYLTVMLALAEYAGRNGVVSVSIRDVADMARLGKTRVYDILENLVSTKHLQIVSTGGGRSSPRVYKILMGHSAAKRPVDDVSEAIEDTKPVVEAKPAPYSPVGVELMPPPATEVEPPAKVVSAEYGHQHVELVLEAAGIKPSADRPFYWNQREHRNDLARIMTDHDMSLDQLCRALNDARQAKVDIGHPALTMDHIFKMVQGRSVNG